MFILLSSSSKCIKKNIGRYHNIFRAWQWDEKHKANDFCYIENRNKGVKQNVSFQNVYTGSLICYIWMGLQEGEKKQRIRKKIFTNNWSWKKVIDVYWCHFKRFTLMRFTLKFIFWFPILLDFISSTTVTHLDCTIFSMKVRTKLN